jgi:tetratricopeptide (TPR) repeat protein
VKWARVTSGAVGVLIASAAGAGTPAEISPSPSPSRPEGLPRFEAHGGDAGDLLAGQDGPVDAEIAREVKRRGFYAGTPVGVADCAGCHADVARQWAGSAHRFSSFNNPYYRVATEEFRREKGAVASRFCGNCHEPMLVASGAMDGPKIDRGTRVAQAGVTCLVCHSTTHVDREGNGRYLVDLRPIPTKAGLHGARVRPPLMNQAQFCVACHKVGLSADLTGQRWLRGQNDYDAWHVSAASGNGAGSVYRPKASQQCQDCHMPLEPAVERDAAAKNGMIRSHRFLGANTALPHLRGDAEQESRSAANLRGRATLSLLWSGPLRIDALMRARGVGHRFPGGTMDSNQVWLEITAFDVAGRAVGRSGGRARGDGALDADTHLVRVQPVDGEGRALLRRDPQHMRGTAFDAALAPSDPQLVRFQVPAGTARVEGRLFYRKFSPAYARLACADLPSSMRRRCLDLPVVEIASDQVAAGAPAPSDPASLLDWGLALADATADHVADARAPLDAARAAWPDRVEPLLGLARLSLRLGRTDDVVDFAQAALVRAPDHPAPLWLAGRALLDAYRFAAALPFAERLARRLPDDRNGLALLARARGLNHDAAGALAAADAILVIDPESEEGYYQRGLALGELGRAGESATALDRYGEYRLAVETDLDLRARWRRGNPDHADESEPCHTHRLKPLAAVER